MGASGSSNNIYIIIPCESSAQVHKTIHLLDLSADWCHDFQTNFLPYFLILHLGMIRALSLHRVRIFISSGWFGMIWRVAYHFHPGFTNIFRTTYSNAELCNVWTGAPPCFNRECKEEQSLSLVLQLDWLILMSLINFAETSNPGNISHSIERSILSYAPLQSNKWTSTVCSQHFSSILYFKKNSSLPCFRIFCR